MNWLQRLFRKRQLEAELDKEIQDHLQRQIADYQCSGLTEKEARRKALLTFGGVEQIREDCRDSRGTRWVESTLEDVRFALRTVSKNPGFTFTAIATLAAGIGANAAIFALLNAVRLRSLPVPDPQKLALIQIEGGNNFGVLRGPQTLSYAVFERIRQLARQPSDAWSTQLSNSDIVAKPSRSALPGYSLEEHGFSGVFAWAPDSFRVGNRVSEHRVNGLWVSGGFFSTLGISPTQGRLFSERDDHPGCGIQGVVISNAFWRSEFAGRDSAIGSKLVIEGHPTEVIGITPPAFASPEIGSTFAVAVLLCSRPSYWPGDDALTRTDFSFLTVMGRLKPNWTLARARAQLASISPAIFQATAPAGYQARSTKNYLRSRLAAYSAGNGVSGLRDTYDTSLWLLLAITGLVLLIGCANLANLMLARATTREREMAIRLAIGGSRWRLIRQLLAEAFVLAATGAILGACLSRLFSRGIVLFLSTQRDSIYLDLTFDWRFLTFAAAVAMSTCLIFGLVPAFRGSRTDPGEAMKSGTRAVAGSRSRGWFQSALVVSQVAISVVLLIAALLFVRSFWNLMTLDPGFREKDVVVASLDFSHVSIPVLAEQAAAAYVQNVLDRMRAIPGVEAAGTSTHIPLDGSSWTLGFNLSGNKGESKFTWVSPGYFESMGKPVLEGRGFDDRETPSAPAVAVVNQTFVRKFLNGVNPLRRTVRTIAEPNYPATEYQIIGVVKDAKYADLREEIPPEVFGSARQRSVSAFQNVFIRSSAPPGAVISAVRQKLNQISPDIRSDFGVLETEVRDGLVRERLMAVLSGFFGALAALLAAIGLYGVISYIVTAQRNQIGIRLALGATRGSIIASVMRQASVLLIGGTGLGIVLALAVNAAARSVLFGIKSNDPVTFISATLLLLTVALAASFVPARRASRLDPLKALRYE